MNQIILIMSKCKYYVTVLKKVSFSKILFKKEYNKACSVLRGTDLRKLKLWVTLFLNKNPHLQLEVF